MDVDPFLATIDAAARPGRTPSAGRAHPITRWNVELVGRLASRLKTLQSFAGTSILYMNGMSNPAMHNNENLPVFLLGDAGGKLRTGRHLRLSGRRYVNDLHATLLSAYGLPTTSFGDPKYVRGPLDGIKQAGAL